MGEAVSLPCDAVVKWTSIRVKVSTLGLFKKYGKKGDSYEDILLRVITALENPAVAHKVKINLRRALYPEF